LADGQTVPVPVLTALAPIARTLGHQRWFATFFRLTVPLDRALGSLTRGKIIGFGVLPTMLITTTGRRSGQPRVTPLLYTPDGDAYLVVGSNWGQAHQPAWALNLIANPLATANVGGERVTLRATLASGAERDRLWRLALAGWPAYETYVKRAGGREIKVFRLERTDSPSG
jgi:deazaflavin-dependent oxidoreductase (nitroreductase family)